MMQDPIVIQSNAFSSLIASAVGGIIAGMVGFSVVWWKRRRDGRDQFLAVVSEIEADLDDRVLAIREVHTASLPKLRAGIFGVRPFISGNSFDRVLKLWQKYKNADQEQLDWALSYSKAAVHDAVFPDKPNPHVRADNWMRARLTEFRNEIG